MHDYSDRDQDVWFQVWCWLREGWLPATCDTFNTRQEATEFMNGLNESHPGLYKVVRRFGEGN